MSRLKVRQIPFHFDENTPYYWNQHNPYWGNAINLVSMIGPAFERYFIKAIRKTIPQITDATLREDADLFCLQEGQHSKQHLAHMQALIHQYPGLEETRLKVMESYEKLFERESIEFHLAYAATVELLFGPIARFMIDNREHLFRECNNQISALILWHFVEEFEHRNSAIDVYNHLVGSYTWRMRMALRVVAHLKEVAMIAQSGMSEHAPSLHWEGKTLRGGDAALQIFRDIPLSNLISFLWHLICCQMPLHKPDRLKQPAWATRWLSDEAAGKNMTVYVP